MAEHHSHSHGSHSHHHGHRHGRDRRAFAAGVFLNTAFVAVEAYYGCAADSLALLADAGHNLSDVLSLLLAWTAAWLAQRKPSQRRTYGLGRSSILAAVANAFLLLTAVGAIALEAYQRLQHPPAVASDTVLWVATAGIAVNGISAALFAAGSKTDLNIRSAFLHMAADAAVSLGVVIAALAIGQTGWYWLDPAISLVIAVVIGLSTCGLLLDAFNLAMDAIPKGIERGQVERFLAGRPGVASVHDLHIWPLSTSSVALTAHLVVPHWPDSDDWLHELSAELQHRFGIGHTTIQLEKGDGQQHCRLEPEEVI
jgi:cobalt-zinc-cadmium efflux system protein